MDNEQTYFLPEAKEMVDKALKERASRAAPKNRAQRRALMKKIGKKNYEDINIITETATKLDYIDLIQKFRELNKKKENEIYEQTTEDGDTSI